MVDLILAAHRAYLSAFQSLTAAARETFETRAWNQGAIHAEQRVNLYRTAVTGVFRRIQREFPAHADLAFWLAARARFLEAVVPEYDADLALTFFYSVMRLALDEQHVPVEYADDGLAESAAPASLEAVIACYSAAAGALRGSIEALLKACAFRAGFEDPVRDAALAAARLVEAWPGSEPPDTLQMLRPVFYRDREAYVAGKLRSPARELPVVFALAHEAPGIRIDALLAGKEDMRNILFVSTRSTFQVPTGRYREVLAFLDTLAPERGHPAMCAVLGFTHPARVALNQRLRRHLEETGERFGPPPGRPGLAMAVFAPPSFPYVFKVVRDYSAKQGWVGRRRVMEVYRWVHEMNRGRLMLDAWLYRNLRFPRAAFDEGVLDDLLRTAPGSVLAAGDTVILKHVYAQRRVQPLSTFFDGTSDAGLRGQAAQALGGFIKDLAGMGLFMGDHYGLPFNTGLTHGFNVVLFDFDDLAPLSHFRFRQTPPFRDEQDELLWDTETHGAWFPVDELDVLVDEWERFLGIPSDQRAAFRATHGDLFTLEFWDALRARVMSGELHYVLPYPASRRLAQSPA